MRCFFILLISTLSLSAQSAVFPNSAVGDNQLKIASNGLPNAPATTLSSTIGNSDTTITVTNGTIIPVNTIITVDSEKISICAKSNNALTVGVAGSCPSTSGRGFDGTTATAHSASAQVWLFIDAWYHNATRVEIEAIEAYLLARTNYKQTITNATSPVSIPASTHLQGTTPTIQCWDNSTPANLSACSIQMDPTTGNITLNASTLSPFSGFVIISAGH